MITTRFHFSPLRVKGLGRSLKRVLCITLISSLLTISVQPAAAYGTHVGTYTSGTGETDNISTGSTIGTASTDQIPDGYIDPHEDIPILAEKKNYVNPISSTSFVKTCPWRRLFTPCLSIMRKTGNGQTLTTA